ncbi:enoyl-CoA hydratase/isomerase family protein [Jidongwangia harbinensis]|uniref:enoyl-CoA hydratase/isomerase family protein n=1 Tax=Jidongwangia harbinensis TaxID=2878561 RepID=UPI001CD9FF55|nr:enoyl-CoA hydratase/isomerase family protein [Jidongwangia harbinensis]MCA2216046.1 enoyl-CoA hydratase/isomerase family protein [Jidongwangia harbinensis]
MKQFTISEVSAYVRRITFANPPVNLVGADTLAELSEAVEILSHDDHARVVIFDSSVPGFFLNHADSEDFARLLAMTGPDAATPVFVDLTTRLAAAPFVSIAAIRGRARGGGAELTLAFDLRYASREEAIFSQPEVALGLIPGGGAGERLPRLIGRDRALEVFLSCHDYDADQAEHYRWVTRTVPDTELDAFVNATAMRIAAFDKQALGAVKKQVNRATLPPREDLLASSTAFAAAASGPGFQDRVQALGELLAAVGAEEVERNMGRYLGMTAIPRR